MSKNLENCKSCGKEYYKSRKDKIFCTRRCKEYYKERKYLMYKKEFCAYCKFIPVHPCQLDVDHIDGNHNNNDESNLQTLCANCHRLKSLVNKDFNKGGII